MMDLVRFDPLRELAELSDRLTACPAVRRVPITTVRRS